MRRIGVNAAVFFLALALAVSVGGPAYSFTEGKNIEILVGYSPAGGHDIEARLIARWLGKYLPGQPNNIIVKNMPGAGGMIQGAYVYSRARPNGLTWAIIGTTHTSSQVLAEPKPKYDLLKMPQLFATSGSGAAIVRDTLGIKKGPEIVKVDPANIVVSGRTLTGSSFLNDALGLELMGIKDFKYVVGYPGTAQMAMAFFSGEISYVGGTGLHHVLGKSGRYHGAVNEGKAVLLWQTGVLTPEGEVVRSPGTDVPTIAEIYREVHGSKPEGKVWEAYKLTGPAMRTLNRSLVLPPGVPPERVAALREALRKLYTDREYIHEWEKVFGLKLDFIPGENADKILRSMLSPSPGWDFLKNEFLPELKAKKS